MSWNDQRSITLTKVSILLFTVCYFFVLLFSKRIVGYLIYYSYLARGTLLSMFLLTIYSCALPIGVILYKLYGLVSSIGQEEIFTDTNISRLRVISWMCFGVAAICLVSSFYYIFFLVVAGAMAFMGLLIRVIKNVFVRAYSIKEENDYTI